MIFKPKLLELIFAGKKTQTRRPAYLGEIAETDDYTWVVDSPYPTKQRPAFSVDRVIGLNGRVRFEVGKSMAAQPGRGKAAPMVTALRTVEGVIRKFVTEDSGDFMYSNAHPARIVIDKIRYEDCRLISDTDVIAEGFQTRAEFLAVWCGFYDPKALYLHDQIGKLTVFDICDKWHAHERAEYLNDWAKAVLANRPIDPYRCWPLNIRPER
jgi:hypothetical protein